MSVDSDGVNESFEGGLRTAVTVAARVGEQLARMREQQAERARAHSEQAAREYAARLNAERALAVGRLEQTKDPEWWKRATADDVGRAYTEARTWEQHDPRAGEAAQRIATEVRARYGIDVRQPDADPAAVQDALARAVAERFAADQERTASHEDANTAVAVIAEADRADRAAEAAHQRTAAQGAGSDPSVEDLLTAWGVDGNEPAADPAARSEAATNEDRGSEARTDAGVAYDSADRRQQFAASLDGKADAETINARIAADRSQATPPGAAVQSEPGVRTRTGARSAGRGRQRQRSGLER